MPKREFLPALRGVVSHALATLYTGGPVEGKDLAQRVRASASGYQVPGQPYVSNWNTRRATEEGYEGNPLVYRAIEVICQHAIGLKMTLRRGDPEEGPLIRADQDPTRLLYVLNRRANPWETALIFRHRLVAQFLLSSKGVFVEVIRTRGDRIGMLNLLDPDLCANIPLEKRDPITDEVIESDPIGTVRIQVPGGGYNYLPRFDPNADAGTQPASALWIRSPHPLVLWKGMSPVQAAGLSIDLDHYARIYNRRFLQNDGRPGGLLSIKGVVDKPVMERLQAQFNGGPESAGRTTVVSADAVSYADTSGSPRDLMWGELSNATRKDISLTFGVPESVMGDASGRCVDMETEALTQRGWLRGDEITTDDTILSMDPVDGVLKWSPVREVYRAHYTGDMYRLRHQHADFLVTPGHNWAVETRTRDRQHGVTTPYLLRKVEDLSTHDRIRTIGEAEAGAEEATYSNAFVELVGWAVTEGHFHPNETSREVAPGKTAPYVRIRQNVGPHADRIAACAKEAGANHIVRETDERRRALISIRGEIAAALHAVAPGKVMTREFILALTSEQRRLLMMTMLDADGCTNIPNTKSWTFGQKSRAASEIFAELATLCGYTTSIRERTFTYRHKGAERPAKDWLVIVRQRKVMTIQRQTRTVEQYDGDVWCPRTDYGTFMARRNGKVLLTGNTFDNADAEYELFWAGRMQSLVRALDDQLDVLTGGQDDDLYLRHDLSKIYVLGRHQRAEEDRAVDDYREGLRTIDEVREVKKLEAWRIPATKVLWLPGGKIPTGQDQADTDAAAQLLTAGAGAPVDPTESARAGAIEGSERGARLHNNNTEARILRLAAGGPERAPAALDRKALPEPEGEQRRARSLPAPEWG